MAKFNIDFTDAKEFIMCEKGEQNFKIVSAELKSYTKDGIAKQKIELTCEVFGGESSGAKVFHSIFLANPTGLYMFLSKLGIAVEKKAYTDMDTNMFVGKTFVATVEHESFVGRDNSSKIKPVIIDTTIRKYNSTNSSDVSIDSSDVDPFEEFGNTVTIDDNFLDD